MSGQSALSRFFVGPFVDDQGSQKLSPTQIIWLGALLVAAQLPQAVHMPIGFAVLGLGLVGLRFLLLRRDVARGRAAPLRIPSWLLAVFAILVAILIKRHYNALLGREPSVTFLFILCGIKFLEARVRRDGTLIACLCAFLLITPFLSSQSMFAAVFAVPAILLLGGALDALERSNSAASAPINWHAPLKRTATMMLQGMPIAALLFLMFPRLAGPLWGLPADHAARTGLSDTMTPGMFTSLTLSDEVAFRVDFVGFPPPPSERYWRGPVLSRFDGRVWSAGIPQFAQTMARPTGRPIEYTVTLEPSDQPRLFALDLPAGPPRIGTGDDRLSTTVPTFFYGVTRDQQLLTKAPVTQPIRYTQVSVLRDSYPATSNTEARANLRVPGGNPRTVAFAQELRARLPDDTAYIAAVLSNYRNEPFVYTLAPPLYEQEPIDQFLFDTRRGFCEHYASSFVLLLRAAGIPARVVTGYQGGEMNPNGLYMIVRQSDAHAWAEALVDGVWRRYDPTAAVAPSRIERGLSSALPVGEALPFLARMDGGWLKDLGLAWDAANHVWRRHVIDFNYQRQRTLWRDMYMDLLMPWQIVGGIALLIGAWGGIMLVWLARRRRKQERAIALWEDVCRRLARAGLPRAQHEGPLAFSQRAAKRWPQFAIAFAAIGEAYASLRYGSLTSPGRERDALVATLAHAINALPSPKSLRKTAAA